MSSTEAQPVAANIHYMNPWCTEEDIPTSRIDGIDDVDVQKMIGAATDLLYVLSGRQYRSGRSVVRPTQINSSYANQSYLYPYSSMSGYGEAWGFAGGWSWTQIGMGWWQNGQDLAELVLQGPVTKINSVIVNGSSLGAWPPPNPNFTLYDRRRLILNIGAGTAGIAWPWNQSIQLPLTESGTFGVDYNWGRPPPPMGHIAAIELATQFILGLSGENKAKLPARVQSVATQGVNILVGDPLTYLRDDLTGLPLVDLFLNAVNPAKLRRRTFFGSPQTVLNREMQPGPPF